jgi:universal stress protein A
LTLQTLLVPVDFSEDSTAALEKAVELAKALGAKLRLLHVFHRPPEIYAPYGGMIPEAATRCLDLELEKVREAGVEAEGEVREGLPSDAIVAAAQQWGADLIVMGTRGHTGLEHVLLGSVAERTLHKAACPVMTVRAGA